ncbi:MAG: SPOR domain-containing protein [Betaproteobacteria bacterium]
MTAPQDVNVDDLKRRARRRLVGAIVLALAAAVFVPMLLESDPKPLGEDVSVKIPPIDDGKFVNRLNEKSKFEPAKTAPPKGESRSEAAKAEHARTEPAKAEMAKLESPAAEPAKPETPRVETARPDAAKSETRTDSGAAATAPKRTLAEAEQKMLGAGKAAAAAPAATPPAAAATPPAAAAPPVAAPPTAAPPATATGELPANGFSVQLGAFSDDKGANALSNKLKRVGYPAYVEPLATSKGTWWRVRVGPYSSRDAAATSRDKLKGEGYSGIVAAAK